MASGPLPSGAAAPALSLPGINRDTAVSLEEFRGKSAVLLGLFRGLHCPFCRRQVFQLDLSHDKLQAAGVQVISVINTPVDRARLYFKHHRVRSLLAADADATAHRAFGVPAFAIAPGPSQWPARIAMEDIEKLRINPFDALPAPLSPFAALEALNKKDDFEVTPVDQAVIAQHGTQLAGHFLIDREGVVRWSDLEATGGMGDVGRFPTPDTILAVARSLS